MDWIVTDDIYAETWRRLLEYANQEITVDRLSKIHGAPTTTSLKQNYIKQAAQARACVLQAHEYYEAAKNSSTFTSPNHLYYGNVALATLVMLIRGTGAQSLDVLRNDRRNSHHGLDFTQCASVASSRTGISLLQQCQVKVLEHGHFGNWYRTLPDASEVSVIVKYSNGAVGRLSRSPIGTHRIQPLRELTNSKFSLLDLLVNLPDLANDFDRLGVSALFTRGDQFVEIDQRTHKEKHLFLLHGFNSETARNAILEKFAVESGSTELFELIEHPPGAMVTLTKHGQENVRFSWPDSRETLNHERIYYAHDLHSHEIVDLYMCSFVLSMLSRYFPDIWVACIESQCKAAKLIEFAVNLQLKKFPVLALTLVRGVETVITTHRQPWKKDISG